MKAESTPGDYYARKREEAIEALAALEKAKCKECHGKGGHYNMEADEYLQCTECMTSGLAPGYIHADRRRLEEAYERACYVGD